MAAVWESYLFIHLKSFPNVYGSELLIIKGWSRKLARRYLPTYLVGGGLINPMLTLNVVVRCYKPCITFKDYNSIVMCTMLSASKLASLDSYCTNANHPMRQIQWSKSSRFRFQRPTQKVFALQIKEHQT